MIDKAALLNYIGANVKYNAEDPLGSYTALLVAINDAPEAGWIPCAERLPESDEMMLVTATPKKGIPNVNRAYYWNGYWHGSGSMSNVTAWMPLPEPYKE
jgi:hypothetical protein